MSSDTQNRFPAEVELLAAASSVARTARQRQVAAIAAAFITGDHDLVDALARDHLVDHPDSVLVAWIASANHQHHHRTGRDQT